jgi:hypothetical protein
VTRRITWRPRSLAPPPGAPGLGDGTPRPRAAGRASRGAQLQVPPDVVGVQRHHPGSKRRHPQPRSELHVITSCRSASHGRSRRGSSRSRVGGGGPDRGAAGAAPATKSLGPWASAYAAREAAPRGRTGLVAAGGPPGLPSPGRRRWTGGAGDGPGRGGWSRRHRWARRSTSRVGSGRRPRPGGRASSGRRCESGPGRRAADRG